MFKNLTEEEYLEIMQDLAIEFYATGSPKPEHLETKITNKYGVNQNEANQKLVLTRDLIHSEPRRRLVKVLVKGPSVPCDFS